jgi:hypothetical protein
MSRVLRLALCTISVFAAVSSPAQVSNFSVDPIRVPAGTILAFHLQTRLRQADADPLDALPQGTILHVKILSAIDSNADRDGSEFHGFVVSDLRMRDGVVVHADSEVRGLLVLLRSKTHPDGFRYELLLTELVDHGKSYPLTASLNTSFYDGGVQPPSTANSPAKVEQRDSPQPITPANTKLTVIPPQ